MIISIGLQGYQKVKIYIYAYIYINLLRHVRQCSRICESMRVDWVYAGNVFVTIMFITANVEKQTYEAIRERALENVVASKRS